MRLISARSVTKGKTTIPIQEIHRDAKVRRHTPQPHNAVALQQLLIPPQPHFAHKPPPVLIQIPILTEEVLFYGGQGDEEGGVVAHVQISD